MLGLFKALSSDEIVIEDNIVIILGAGGAARAAAFMCALNKAKSVYLLNRTFEKAKIIANEVNNFFNCECIFPMKLSDYSKLPNKKFLAIQATNVGLYPDINQVVIDDKAFYEKIHTGYDLIYKPRNTLFMQNVKKNGGKAFNGLKMLLYQGITAYELWNDVSVPSEVIEYVYKELDQNICK